MKKIKLQDPHFLGYVNKERKACRGLIVKDSMILLGYEQAKTRYIIPGGGVEANETLEECCIRELLEETGIKCKPIYYLLELEELFSNICHINHYFVCPVIEETHQTNFTAVEKEVGLTNRWVSIDEALSIFGSYEQYMETEPSKYGLYRREYMAMKAYKEYLKEK